MSELCVYTGGLFNLSRFCPPSQSYEFTIGSVLLSYHRKTASLKHLYAYQRICGSIGTLEMHHCLPVFTELLNCLVSVPDFAMTEAEG